MIYSGAGNTFTCVDNRKGDADLSPLREVDGLLILENSDKADFRMRIINRDGSEADMCGNGLRCFKLYLEDLGYSDVSYTIETNRFVHTLTSDGDQITATMAPPIIHSWRQEISIDGHPYRVPYLDTGVPHIVIPIREIDAAPVERVGPQVCKQFPEGTNVNFASTEGSLAISVRTWERGVNRETEACGTGATASAIALFRRTSQVQVHVRSGQTLQVAFECKGDRVTNVRMRGGAAELCLPEAQ